MLPGHASTPPKRKEVPLFFPKLLKYLIYFMLSIILYEYPSWSLASNSTIRLHAGLTSTNSSQEPPSSKSTAAQISPFHLSGSHCTPASAITAWIFLCFTCPPPFLILSYSNCSLLSKSGKSILSASSLIWHFSITIWFCNSNLLVHVRAFQQLFLLLMFCSFDILLTKSILAFPNPQVLFLFQYVIFGCISIHPAVQLLLTDFPIAHMVLQP